jgi:hypothetical protein
VPASPLSAELGDLLNSQSPLPILYSQQRYIISALKELNHDISIHKTPNHLSGRRHYKGEDEARGLGDIQLSLGYFGLSLLIVKYSYTHRLNHDPSDPYSRAISCLTHQWFPAVQATSRTIERTILCQMGSDCVQFTSTDPEQASTKSGRGNASA